MSQFESLTAHQYERKVMYVIAITYDTGDSFHQENGVVSTVEELSWTSLTKAKKALKDIEKHYYNYMILHKEWNAGKEEKDKALRSMEASKWYNKEYPEYYICLEDDKGDRVEVNCFWCGYFEHLVGADIEDDQTDGLSIRIRGY